jgi:hypothetical protein
MKKLYKAILLAIPALAVALAVGATTMGCGDTSTGTDAGIQDLSTGNTPD